MSDLKKTLVELRKVFNGIAGQYCGKQDQIDDAVQMLYEMFLTMNQQTLNKIYEKDGRDGLIKYGAVTIRRYFTSSKNKYYYTYRRYYENLKVNNVYDYNFIIDNYTDNTDTKEKWEYFEQLDTELDKMYWYDQEIYKLYYSVDSKETLDTLAKKTGISRNSLFTTIDNVRKTLIENLKDE